MKLSIPFHGRRRRDRRASSPRPQAPPQDSQPQSPDPPSQDRQTQEARRTAMLDAHDYIHTTLSAHDRFAAHMSSIRITCPHTLEELIALGRLPQSEGVPACRKLVRVPVIHDAIGVFLWTHLGSLAAARASTATSSHDDLAVRTSADDMPREQQHAEAVITHLDARFRFDKPAWEQHSRRPGSSRYSADPASPTAQSFEDDEDGRRQSQASSGRTSWRRSSQACNFCAPDCIAEMDEDGSSSDVLYVIHGEALEATRGRTVRWSRTGLAAARPRGFPSSRGLFNASVNESQALSLNWYCEDVVASSAAPSVESRASSVHSRAGSLVGRLGSVIGGYGIRIGWLGESLAYGYGCQPPNNGGRASTSL